MERVGFRMRVRAAGQDEYRRRHAEVWPELLAELKRAGCKNYSIFMDSNELFGYMEVESFPRFLSIMSQSAVNERWQAYMLDVLDPMIDPGTGFHRRMEEVFHLD
jgi:L-rhamnose mutarotase